MYPLVFHNSSWLLFKKHYFLLLAPACQYCMDLTIFQGLTFNKTSLGSSINHYVHFCLPQSLKQNHFVVCDFLFVSLYSFTCSNFFLQINPENIINSTEEFMNISLKQLCFSRCGLFYF